MERYQSLILWIGPESPLDQQLCHGDMGSCLGWGRALQAGWWRRCHRTSISDARRWGPGDIPGSALVCGAEEREQQISLPPLPLLSQSTGPPFL